MNIGTCTTCKSLEYDGNTGKFSCNRGVEEVKQHESGWDFDYECPEWEFLDNPPMLCEGSTQQDLFDAEYEISTEELLRELNERKNDKEN